MVRVFPAILVVALAGVLAGCGGGTSDMERISKTMRDPNHTETVVSNTYGFVGGQQVIMLGK